MNTITLTIACVLVVGSNALLFDVVGGLKQLDAFLVKACRPISAPMHGSVSCAYSAVDLTCTASCDAGFHFDGFPVNGKVSLKCSTTKVWPNGVNFPSCISGSGQTGTGTGTGTGTMPSLQPPMIKGTCVSMLTACPSEGDFHACTSCSQFVTCAPDGIFIRNCPEATYWDDTLKRCALVSSTCS